MQPSLCIVRYFVSSHCPVALRGTGSCHILSCAVTLFYLQVLTKNCWTVFFSPSGVQFVLPLLKMYCNVQDLKVQP